TSPVSWSVFRNRVREGGTENGRLAEVEGGSPCRWQDRRAGGDSAPRRTVRRRQDRQGGGRVPDRGTQRGRRGLPVVRAAVLPGAEGQRAGRRLHRRRGGVLASGDAVRRRQDRRRREAVPAAAPSRGPGGQTRVQCAV